MIDENQKEGTQFASSTQSLAWDFNLLTSILKGQPITGGWRLSQIIPPTMTNKLNPKMRINMTQKFGRGNKA